MPKDPISFHNKNSDFTLKNSTKVAQWITHCIEKENLIPGPIAFIFTSDSYLREINEKYLNHDTYTDVIGFDYSENNTISGDVFISIDRVRENAYHYSSSFPDELHRVMIHGLLHFCGYDDKRPGDKDKMREKEDYCLSLRTF